MKLIKYKQSCLYLPTDKELKSEFFKLKKDDSLILVPDSVDVRETRQIKPYFTIDQTGVSNLIKVIENDEVLRKQFTDQCLIIIYPNKFDYNSLGALTSEPDYKVDIIGNFKKQDLIEKESIPQSIKAAAKSVGLFSVGRVNGPADKVTSDKTIEDIRIRYDVNSRIEISKDDFVLTFTFKPERLRNMAKLTRPDGSIAVVLEKDFDLWLLGLYVLLDDYNDSIGLFNELLNRYK